MTDQAIARDAEERRLQLVLDIARDVTGRRHLADVLAATLGGLRRVIDFGGGSIQLLDDEGWISMAAADPAVPEDVMSKIRVPLSGSVGGRIILTERAIYVPDRSVEAPLPKENFSPGGVRSYFGVPLITDGEAIGLLQIDSPDVDPWSEADRLIVICMAPVASAAIQNARAAARQAAAETSSRQLLGRRTLLSALIDNELQPSVDNLAGLVEPGSAAVREVERLAVVTTKMRASLEQLVEADGGDAQR